MTTTTMRGPQRTPATTPADTLGAGIALDSWLSILALVFIPLLAVLVRIHLEEAQLATALGPDYTRYASRTHLLVPGLW